MILQSVNLGTSPVPTLGVWQGNLGHLTKINQSASPSLLTTAPQPTEPLPAADIIARRRRRCGTRGAMRNVRPRSPPSSGPARCRQKRCQYRTQPLAAKPTSFCISIRRHAPLPENPIVSSPQARHATRKITHYSEICQGLVDRPAPKLPSRRFPRWTSRRAFHAFQTLGGDPAEPGKSGGDHSREGFMDRMVDLHETFR